MSGIQAALVLERCVTPPTEEGVADAATLTRSDSDAESLEEDAAARVSAAALPAVEEPDETRLPSGNGRSSGLRPDERSAC